MTELALIFGIGILGLAFSAYLGRWVLAQTEGDGELPRIGALVRAVTEGFVRKQSRTIGAVAAVLGGAIFLAYGLLRRAGEGDPVPALELGVWLTVSFALGVAYSLATGHVAQWIGVRAGVRSVALARALALTLSGAAALVALLEGHEAVSAVHYPGLRTHPGHALARRQQSGFGGMLSFELAGGEAAVRALVDGLECFTLAESLGGVESLVAHPATMTHAAMTAEARAAAGITDGLLRLSVGIEHADDLVADLRAALQRAQDAAGCKRQAAR